MNTGSSIFLLIGATALLALLGLPLLLFPLTWARFLGWKIPEQTDLANYLGRSLGAVSLSVAAVAYSAARDPWQYRHVFDLVILMGIFLTGVHLYGMIKRSQPAFENVEVVVWPMISVVAWYLYPQKPV
jgi:hypothetical protein